MLEPRLIIAVPEVGNRPSFPHLDRSDEEISSTRSTTFMLIALLEILKNMASR